MTGMKKRVVVELEDDEILVLQYIIGGVARDKSDPLKDIYEAGPRASEESFKAYESLGSMAPKVLQACSDAVVCETTLTYS
jgi:hypothetical protein